MHPNHPGSTVSEPTTWVLAPPANGQSITNSSPSLAALHAVVSYSWPWSEPQFPTPQQACAGQQRMRMPTTTPGQAINQLCAAGGVHWRDALPLPTIRRCCLQHLTALLSTTALLTRNTHADTELQHTVESPPPGCQQRLQMCSSSAGRHWQQQPATGLGWPAYAACWPELRMNTPLLTYPYTEPSPAAHITPTSPATKDNPHHIT